MLRGRNALGSVIRRFRNKCDIVEESNSSSKHGKRVELNTLEGKSEALLMFFILGMIAKVTQTLNFSIIPETSIRRFWNNC